MRLIEIEGPGRDYDVAYFCLEHYVEADEFAREWLSELIDDLVDGDAVTITARLSDNEGTTCSVCQPED